MLGQTLIAVARFSRQLSLSPSEMSGLGGSLNDWDPSILPERPFERTLGTLQTY